MAETQMDHELQELKADVAKLRQDVAGLTTTLKDMGFAKAEDVRTSMQDQLRRQREEIRRRWGAARQRGRQTLDEVEETIGEHPLGSLAAAAGVGFIIAKILEVGAKR